MKEETNAANQPSEAEMKDMYRNAWLDYYADAEQAKQDLRMRYAKMVKTFGSYKQMPDGIKEILKEEYASHDAKWSENGDEMVKRFGNNDTQEALKGKISETKQKITEVEASREAFLQKLQEYLKQPEKAREYEL